MLFAAQKVIFRLARRVFKQSRHLDLAGHQFLKRKHLFRGRRTLAPHAPAAVPSNRIKPDGERPRIVYLGQMLQRAVKHLLHRVFSVFRVTAHLHAEGVNGLLQQADGFLGLFRCISV